MTKPGRRRRGALTGLDRRYDTEPASSIDAGVLETFPYEYRGDEEVVKVDTGEFTAVCPYSGLPDFGTIRIEYVPDRDVIELRSLKYYLFSFRNVGIYQEHVAARVLRDLVRCCRPVRMRVEVDYNIRGGVHTTVFREWARRSARARARGGGGR